MREGRPNCGRSTDSSFLSQLWDPEEACLFLYLISSQGDSRLFLEASGSWVLVGCVESQQSVYPLVGVGTPVLSSMDPDLSEEGPQGPNCPRQKSKDEPPVVPATMSDVDDNDEECWNSLEAYRVKLIAIIDPTRITPFLRQCRVLNREDEEQVFNDPSLVIRRRKVGVLLDILQRTGKKGYIAFLESLELYYPQLYERITGKEPARVFSMIIDTAGESSLTQLLMSEILKLQQVIQEERRKAKELGAQLCAKDDSIRQLQVKDRELRKHQERVQKMKEERDHFSEELRKLKEDNYELAMKFANQSEEKNAALMRNRDLQLEIDHLKHKLMKAEDDCNVERKHTLKLKHAMQQRPSQDVIYEMQRENDLLKAKLQELDSSLQICKDGKAQKNRLYIQTLEDDRRQALEEHQDLVNNVYNLRKNLRQTEEFRDKYMEEKEVAELQCLTLRKDSKMYKERIEAILQQMEEVSIERDQAILTREQFHQQYSKSLKDKDLYRKQLRELGEKCDELQILVFRTEGKLLAAETKLKQLDPPTSTSDFDENNSSRASQEITFPGNQDLGSLKNGIQEISLDDSQDNASMMGSIFPFQNGKRWSSGEPECKEKRRIKKHFDDYRRKKALRSKADNLEQGDCDNTTGSDTDGL